MNLDVFIEYLTKYGMLAVFIIVFLEYLNLPGFPAGVIMPMAGIWARELGSRFIMVLLVSTAAGLIGSWLLYFLGYFVGNPILTWFKSKFKKQGAALDKAIAQVNEKGYYGLLLAKLFPAIRTIISIPAGTIKMNFYGYTAYSALGILIWNGVFIGAGYFFGSPALKWLANL